jgi:acetyl/propionyl-CoA carboxylase alpha subunit
LVKEQIRVAQGEVLGSHVSSVQMRGHAIEIRVCAEDPSNNFSPDVGTISHFEAPQGPGIRLDSGYGQGDEIPIFYDPLMAKLIVFAQDRASAIDRMIRAIAKFDLRGVSSTLGFCNWVMHHPDFRDGWFDTHFIARKFSPEMLNEPVSEEELLAVGIAALELGNQKQIQAPAIATKSGKRQWKNRLDAGRW